MKFPTLLATFAATLMAGGVMAQTATATSPAAVVTAPAANSAPALAGKPEAAPAGDSVQGKLAWYGRKFAGRKTASGQRFNPGAMTMAHKTLPFGTRVKVTNLKNNQSVVVRVNDRGPNQADRIGDVSQAAAAQLRMLRSGVIEAKLEVLSQATAVARKAQKKA